MSSLLQACIFAFSVPHVCLCHLPSCILPIHIVSQKYPENKNDLIAYFSAEYGLDQTIAIYSGGLGILSGDHLKSASDLGIPLVAVGLLYKNGYFNQIIDRYGMQRPEYRDLDIYDLPITPVKDFDGNDLILFIKFPKRRIY